MRGQLLEREPESPALQVHVDENCAYVVANLNYLGWVRHEYVRHLANVIPGAWMWA